MDPKLHIRHCSYSFQSSQNRVGHETNCNKSEIRFFLQLYVCSLNKKVPSPKACKEKLQGVKLVVLKSLYKDQTRKKPKHKIFEGLFKTLNKMFRSTQLLGWFMFSNVFQDKASRLFSNQGVLSDEKFTKLSYFHLFDLKSSVAWLILIKIIKYVHYYVLFSWRGRNNCNYTI